ncbi:MAG: hypothetical protein EU547_00830 [Promethearchaeota archaeon]|nr:MAG: hypothetical protein EU547_00830 [Candidatus Lokiarchaeota archaeon]
MKEHNSSDSLSPSINLERSELRYIFYQYDQPNLMDDLLDIGFKEHIFAGSPFTKTMYFGSKIGLKPGLSVKARKYDALPEENIFHIAKEDVFNILEIKSTIEQDDYFFHGLLNIDGHFEYSQNLIEEGTFQIPGNMIVEVQRASEDGLLRDSTLKTKSRIKKTDISKEKIQSELTLKEIITLLCRNSDLDFHLSQKLKTILNNRIRPLFYNNLFPYVMTQYRRHHFLPLREDWEDLIRITIDPGVEYYDLRFQNPQNYLVNPELTGEYLKREKFCRLEIKMDPSIIKKELSFKRKLSNLLKKYGCLAHISKKWSGSTLVSERHIERQVLWKEPFGTTISGFFPIDPNWFSYGETTESLYKIIDQSKNFSTYEDEPRILVKNRNFIRGQLGVPVPSLELTIEGNKITYNAPSEGHIVKMIKNQPEFYIVEENLSPIRSTLISSKKELDNILHPSIEIEGYTFFRSYGFLTVNINSNRVYKLTIERKTELRDKLPRSKIYCKLRYLGNEVGLSPIDRNDIYGELQIFYNEFFPAMQNLSSSSSVFVNVPKTERIEKKE